MIDSDNLEGWTETRNVCFAVKVTREQKHNQTREHAIATSLSVCMQAILQAVQHIPI